MNRCTTAAVKVLCGILFAYNYAIQIARGYIRKITLISCKHVVLRILSPQYNGQICFAHDGLLYSLVSETPSVTTLRHE